MGGGGGGPRAKMEGEGRAVWMRTEIHSGREGGEEASNEFRGVCQKLRVQDEDAAEPKVQLLTQVFADTSHHLRRVGGVRKKEQKKRSEKLYE